jgi:Rhodopirellula transposase DDE domain
MRLETAGDPISGLKWTHKATEKIATALQHLGIHVGKSTVGRVLKTLNFSLRVNHKKRSHGSPATRDLQFRYIRRRRTTFAVQGDPIISVDAKKRELVGNFKNDGKAWSQAPRVVNDHDFRSLATGVAIPYVIYNTEANRAFVCVGTSRGTPEFAVDSIERWWRLEGRRHYPDSNHVLILADGGGGNGHRARVWKARLQDRVCDRHQLTITVCHYPPGASKWNPVEHRVNCEISRNWQAVPLDSYETVLKYIRTTTTATGLRLRAHLIRKQYDKGRKVADAEMEQLSIQTHTSRSRWNYTLSPRADA